MPAGRSRPAGMGSWFGPPTRRTVPANTASRGRGSRSASRSSTGRAGGWRSRRRGRARRSRFCRAARWGGSTGRTRAPYMCTRPPRVAPHTSPSRRLRRFCFPVRPIRANVDGRRPPAAATTRRNRVHDPARNRLDRHPRCPPRGTATAHLQPPGADPGGLVDAYLQDYQVRQFRSHSTARGRTAHLVAFFGRDARAATLTTYQIRQYQLTRRAAGAATGTINRETSALHRMCTLAVHWGWLDTVPGFPDRLRENPPRQGFFEHPEYLAVRAHLPAPWQDILDLAYYSGWRKQEILGLTWEEIDEAGGVIRLSPARSKTLVGWILPISQPIADALARRRARRDPDSPLVFHRDGITIRRWRTAWRTACQAAGVPTRSLHDRYIQCIFLESSGYKESP